MDSPKKYDVPIAVKQYSNIKSSARHITTANFMEYSIARCKELPKGTTYKFDMRTTVRLKPMQSPTFGNIEIHNRAFFVPFRLVMPGFNDFDNDTPYFGMTGNPIRIPNAHRLDNALFVQLFVKSEMSSVVPSSERAQAIADETFDFIRYNGSDPIPYRFTSLGRYAYKILRQLGYGVYFNGTATKGSGPYSSALPLLCWMRPFFDWYFPSMYVDDSRANFLRRWFNVTPSGASSFTQSISADDLLLIFQELRRVSYDTDYYTGVWDNPVAPNSGSFSSISAPDVTQDITQRVLTTDSNGTPVLGGSSISQYGLDLLKSVSDFMHRNQIAGARTIDRFMARFGSAPISAKILRSQYVAEYVGPVRVGDVTSTANSDGTPLGGYAGKGFGIAEQNTFVNYTADEAGMLIVISTIVPEPIYYQGVDRHTLHLNMLDFYHPEFDNKGVQAMSTREVFMPTGLLDTSDQGISAIDFDNSVFGFVPRYAEYKVEPSQITGDIALGSKNVGMEGWTLGRDLTSYFDGVPYADVVHTQSFVDGLDASQYNRIFDYFGDDEDKFIVEHQFLIDNRFPGAPLYDGYEYDTSGKAPTVSIDVNGVRAN